VVGNGIDDDCDGLADEVDSTPSSDTSDSDGDGVSLADGDCDDTRSSVKPGLMEVCGDGLDNDCDGVADWDVDAETPYCSPFDAELDTIFLDDSSFDGSGGAAIAFTSGTITMVDGTPHLVAGPSLVNITLPVADGIPPLDLQITAATIDADLVKGPDGWIMQNGRLGGVLDARSTDQIRGLRIDVIDLKPEDSLADAIYANALGALFGLKQAEPGTAGEGCLTPDIDVDADGLEAFCDTNPSDDNNIVGKCVDGDGTTVILDEGSTQCTEALDDDGTPRFVDGVSILLRFETTAAVLPSP
jgi:hypothetical protein